MPVRHPRVNCCIPFCRRGSTQWPVPYEFLCGKHYGMADKALRLLRTRIRRRRRLVDARPSDVDRDERLDRHIWKRIKQQILTRSM